MTRSTFNMPFRSLEFQGYSSGPPGTFYYMSTSRQWYRFHQVQPDVFLLVKSFARVVVKTFKSVIKAGLEIASLY